MVPRVSPVHLLPPSSPFIAHTTHEFLKRLNEQPAHSNAAAHADNPRRRIQIRDDLFVINRKVRYTPEDVDEPDREACGPPFSTAFSEPTISVSLLSRFGHDLLYA